ncbi:hypothetical protein G6027_16245 [Dietzia sp. SLG310A2-38A2]|nr:hypothetical protein [Dietzia sp. SLG310A2-38A2]
MPRSDDAPESADAPGRDDVADGEVPGGGADRGEVPGGGADGGESDDDEFAAHLPESPDSLGEGASVSGEAPVEDQEGPADDDAVTAEESPDEGPKAAD